MKTRPLWKPCVARIAFAVCGALSVAISAHALNPLVPAPEPLANAMSSVQPNIMFVLDDSGSMGWDYMPDYVNDSHNPTTTTAGCVDAGDDGGGIGGSPDACIMGDPPFNSSDFNSVYYNPNIFYRPGANYDGTSMQIQNLASTVGWTAVQVNPYTTSATTSLATGYPDRVWCKSQGDIANGGNCTRNTAYRYPDAVYPYGETGGGSIKYLNGAPYYYRMQTARFCSDAARTNCVSGADVVPGTHTLLAPEFCTDQDLTNCTAGASVTASHKFSGARWCNNTGRREDTVPPIVNACQRKKIGAFIHAKHLGTTKSQAGPFSALPNKGNISVTNVMAAGGRILNIAIGGVSVITGPIVVPAGTTSSDAAGFIVTAINGLVSSPDYLASQPGGSNVTVTRVPDGATGAGAAIVVTTDQIGTQSSIGRLDVTGGPNNNQQEIITLTVNGVNLLCPIVADDFSYGSNVSVRAANGRIRASSGTNAASERTAFRTALRNRINACAVNGYQATIVGTEVRIIAPQALGAGPNTQAVSRTGTGSLTNFVVGNMGTVQLGASSNVVQTTTLNMTGGQDEDTSTASRTVRVGYGSFSRTDIVPSNNSYPKGGGRVDCAGAECTYDEEMTNFANWYAYYRTRMQMMKTSVGRAFIPVDDTYRVGFITINPGSSVSSSKYLKVADYDATHKQAWYTKLYAQNPGPSTPLREALSRVGWIFGGKLNTGLTSGIPATDDPMIASCQPNFAILSTDGYWNGPGGQNLSAGAMGNEDNVNSGYSTQQSGAFDALSASNTLADVAMYYYKNDLRTSGAFAIDNVPTTTKNSASHQHMVTFTLGLGLDGQLSYDPSYETAVSGDFVSIKQGVMKWPIPVADSPTALDDLWHAAVNGRGVFFSAKNPDDLANGLAETLNSLKARVGAAAAAATSNLKPVSGDNFAFVAQYQTSDWIGDLTGRTIDLSTGTVSNIMLWSAAFVLDATPYSSRSIYTYDPTDADNLNKLKHFCWPGGGVGCTDGAGLDATEQAYFNPNLLPQWTSFTLPQQTTASGQNLVNYLRGDASMNNTGQSLTTDLYRERLSMLGDMVNAQPQYLRKSPFAYNDNGHAAFKQCTEGVGTLCPVAQFPDPTKPRRGTVYAASNDGMLHAFETDVNNNAYYQTAGVSTTITTDDVFTGNNAGNGAERWAYIPAIVLPELYKLASTPYSHRYYTDGSPLIGDICISTPCAGLSDWRSILVAGLNSGGMGYYALDITNPFAPKALWEFQHSATCLDDTQANSGTFNSDCHLGLSYGNPLIVKRKSDGRWVVIVTSGYNNDFGGGDGKGYLYVLDAVNGKILQRLTTGSGTVASPSGLGKINGWVTNASRDNTVLTVYGGDLDGNMWRFDLDPGSAGSPGVVKVAQVTDAMGNPQPITVKPELTEILANSALRRVVLFGTGKFLENADKADTTTKNSIYALRDDLSVLSGTVIANVRTASLVIPRQFTAGVAADERRIAAATGPDWFNDYGWLLDLPDPGERANVDPRLELGTFIIASNVPSGDTCSAGGSSFINNLDFRDGSAVAGALNESASRKISSALIAGISVVMLPGGKIVTLITKTGATGSGGAATSTGSGSGGQGGGVADFNPIEGDEPTIAGIEFSGRRVSWRELIKEQ